MSDRIEEINPSEVLMPSLDALPWSQHFPDSLLSHLDSLLTSARPRLLRLVRRRGVPLESAEDIVQQTCIEAWRHLDHLRSPASFDAWLDGICRNLCLRWARTQVSAGKRQVSLEDLLQQEGMHNSALAWNQTDPFLSDPLEALLQKDQALLLKRALETLPGPLREAIEVSYLHHLPQDEAARRLGLTLPALKARLHRGRRQLRFLLGPALHRNGPFLNPSSDQQQPLSWREARQWCRLCGRHRLHGIFEPMPNGTTRLRIRCPTCSPRYGIDLIDSGSCVAFPGRSSFQPALKRLSQLLAPPFAGSFLLDKQRCLCCGEPVQARIIGPGEPDRLLPQRFLLTLRLDCAACGTSLATWAGSLIPAMHLPARQFMQRHPRSIVEPEEMTEYKGQSVLRVSLTDVASTARLVLLAHPQTLQVLATFQA